MSVLSLPKLHREHCQHECEDGCGIYEKRPVECRDYTCIWREGAGVEAQRPDRLGVFVDRIHGVLQAREVWEGAFMNPSTTEYLRMVAKRFSRSVYLVKWDGVGCVGAIH